MAPKKLVEFRFEPMEDDDNVKLAIIDDSGEELELIAAREQLDLLAERIDQFVDTAEEAEDTAEANKE